jgi:hypothetical protein
LRSRAMVTPADVIDSIDGMLGVGDMRLQAR